MKKYLCPHGILALLLLLVVAAAGCGGTDVTVDEPDGDTAEEAEEPATEPVEDEGTAEEEEPESVEVLGDLRIGDRVIDTSWSWEFRAGEFYSLEDRFDPDIPDPEEKPVVWIVIARDHYDGLPPHVTLMSEELIGRHPFDDSEERLNVTGYSGTSYWLDSGTGDAQHGLRPFLNSLDKSAGYSYAEDGFYSAFSDSFKNAVLETTVPHITRVDEEGNWDEDNPWRQYNTEEKVFVLSIPEYGIEFPEELPYSGSVVPYFDPQHPDYPTDGMQAWERDMKEAHVLGEQHMYWSRTPTTGQFFQSVHAASTSSGDAASSASGNMGVRPVVNLQADAHLSEAPDEDGVYHIEW